MNNNDNKEIKQQNMLKPKVSKHDDVFFRDPLQRILFNFPDTEEMDQVCI